MSAATPALILHRLGLVDYAPTLAAMQEFTARRTGDSPDELWLLEHPPIFTLGQAGRREHLLQDVGIPVLGIDRGGQITYHGPGQVVVYLLLDLKRRGYGVKELVRRMEQAVIDLLATATIPGERLAGAPGVYVAGAKIAALGLRVKGGCTYHGHAGMAVTQLRDLGWGLGLEDTAEALLQRLSNSL